MAIQMPIQNLLQQVVLSRQSILKGLDTNDTDKVRKGIENLSLLIGRCLTDMAQSNDANLISESMSIILSANETLQQVQPNLSVNPDKPSEWVSFDGKVKYPLFVDKSKIPNANNGLFCEQDIKMGETIAPCRLKVANTGDFFKDWNSFEVASKINHHPIPNVKIVRSKPPMALQDEFFECCYVVATRDIKSGDEIVSDYRDNGWAEWDYFKNLDLPFEQWNKNCLGVDSTNLVKAIKQNPMDYQKTIGVLIGTGLLYASSKKQGLSSLALALSGVAITGYTVFKDSEFAKWKNQIL